LCWRIKSSDCVVVAAISIGIALSWT
jgi:hypothetical protein